MALKDFLRGAGSILSIYPPDRDDVKISIPHQSDEEAIRSDWEAVGNDLRFAIERCKNGER